MSEVITVSEIGQKKLIEQFPSINNIYDISATCIAVSRPVGAGGKGGGAWYPQILAD